MSKSFALVLAALAFSAASALASPFGAPAGDGVGGSVPQQSRAFQTAQNHSAATTQFGSGSQAFSGYNGNTFVPPSASVSATPAPVRDSTLPLVNETGGGG
ncbi:MAG TPA: hypothetical protein VMA37_10505 [Acetobacteraceae bacterium]|nr:hypothetical protein [Acetobacteraceae bacterium]